MMIKMNLIQMRWKIYRHIICLYLLFIHFKFIYLKKFIISSSRNRSNYIYINHRQLFEGILRERDKEREKKFI